MLTKLTLTIDESVISRAKQYAQNKNKSVSRLVEEYLDVISDNTTKISLKNQLSSPITDSLVGMFTDTGDEYKKMLEDALLDKYQ